MAIRDYWIYQERTSENPWAVYVVKEYDKRHPQATCLDYTLYSELIDEPTNAFSRVGVHCDYVRGYVYAIISDLCSFGIEVAHPDLIQLANEIKRILKD